MKKYLFGLLAIMICVTLVGCGKEKEKEENTNKMVGGWEILLTDKEVISEEELTTFNKAKEKYGDLKLEPVVLLGEQLVAGKNYMYLAKGYKEDKSDVEYKVVIVYKDLQNNTSITSVKDFDVSKYAGVEMPKKYAEAVGSWEVNGTGKALMLEDEKVQNAFDNATSKLDSMIFNPICVLAKQLVSGTNYAVLTYGKGTNEDTTTSIYVATLYEDLQGNSEITYLAYINLADFNK